MANPEHVKRLVESHRDSWNAWREANPYELVDLHDENLELSLRQNWKVTSDDLADLSGYDLRMTNLQGTNLSNTDLSGAVINDAFPPMFNAPPPAQYNTVGFVRSRMVGTKLINANLNECVFTGANLKDADLTDAKLPGSILNSANLSGATLHGTDFAGANLTGACFKGCDLRATKLVGAKLQCTSLAQADKIFGVPIHQRAREAFEDGFASTIEECQQAIEDIALRIAVKGTLNESDSGITKYTSNVAFPFMDRNLGTIKSVSQLQDLIDRHVHLFDCIFPRRRFQVYYRGIGCSKWPLNTSLDRAGLRHIEPELLRELVKIEPDEFRDASSIFDQLVLARHHSLPARLLDVTKNPEVALYFACKITEDSQGRVIHQCESDEEHGDCERSAQVQILICPVEMIKPYDSDSISVLAAMSRLGGVEEEVLLTGCPDGDPAEWVRPDSPHQLHPRPDYLEAMHRLFHFVAREKPYFENAIDPRDFFRVFVVEPRRSFTRLRAQSAAFLVSAFHRSFKAEEIARNGPKFPIYDHYTIDIPHDAKQDIMRQLGYVQINDETMLPGLQPVAEAIAGRYR